MTTGGLLNIPAKQGMAAAPWSAEDVNRYRDFLLSCIPWKKSVSLARDINGG